MTLPTFATGFGESSLYSISQLMTRECIARPCTNTWVSRLFHSGQHLGWHLIVACGNLSLSLSFAQAGLRRSRASSRKKILRRLSCQVELRGRYGRSAASRIMASFPFGLVVDIAVAAPSSRRRLDHVEGASLVWGPRGFAPSAISLTGEITREQGRLE